VSTLWGTGRDRRRTRPTDHDLSPVWASGVATNEWMIKKAQTLTLRTRLSAIALSTDSPTPIDDEVRQLYDRYQGVGNDAERHAIALEKLDGCRHAEIYEAHEDE